MCSGSLINTIGRVSWPATGGALLRQLDQRSFANSARDKLFARHQKTKHSLGTQSGNAVIYDLLVHAAGTLVNLSDVFNAIRQSGLCLHPCHLFWRETSFLGYVVGTPGGSTTQQR